MEFPIACHSLLSCSSHCHSSHSSSSLSSLYRLARSCLLPVFMKEKPTVKGESACEEENAYAIVCFLRSGLVEISNYEFQRMSTPLRHLPGRAINFWHLLKKHLSTIDGYPIPADITLLEIMRGIHHAFFIIESKSYIGSMLNA